MAAASQDALAQGTQCVTIRPGNTAAQLAARLTGDSSNAAERWFQILDPATSRFVSKSNYDHIRAGWLACLLEEKVIATQPAPTGWQPVRAASDSIVRLVQRLDSNGVLWGWLVVLIALLSRWSHQYLRERTRVMKAMEHFAEGFVREFERPLFEPGAAERPIQSQIRFTPHRARVDVLLSPNRGRRYPNLTDHKNNFEYDVTRVLRALSNQSFVNGHPYAQGRWVVVPFQLTAGITEAGSR
jgi:hypothetical protein